MKKILLSVSAFASSFIIGSIASAQCPSFKGVLVDACNGSGSEGDNEFMLLRNGTASQSPSALDIYYSPTLTGGAPSGTVNSSTVHFGGSGFSNTYTTAELTIIDNLNAANTCTPATQIFARPATSATTFTIPANAFMIVMQSAQTATYNWTGLCSQAQTQPVWILFEHNNNVNGNGSSYGNGFNTGGGGRFKNYGASSANNSRYFSLISSAYPACTEQSTVLSYDYTQLPASGGTHDGGSVSWDATGIATYGNNGCNAPTVLPVRLLEFTGSPRNGALILDWEVSCETSMLAHVLEKSSGSDFLPIANIPAMNSGCGSNSHYTFTDLSFGTGTQLYRLRMTDFDDHNNYSATLHFNGGRMQSREDIRLLVNPVNAQLQVCGMLQGSTYRVTDLAGKILMNGSAAVDDATQIISVAALQPGLYLLQSNAAVLKFIKQ